MTAAQQAREAILESVESLVEGLADEYTAANVEGVIANVEKWAAARAAQLDPQHAEHRQELKSIAHTVARIRTKLDDIGKGSVADLKARTKAVDAVRRSVRERLDRARDRAKEPAIKYEADLKRRHEERLARENAEREKRERQERERREAEFQSKEAELLQRQRDLEARERAHEERERQAREEREHAERERRAAEERAEAERRAEERRQQEERERAEREQREAAERAERERRAEERRQQEERERAERERQRREDEEREEQERTQRVERRAKHAAQVRDEIMEALAGLGLNNGQWLLQHIEAGDIPHLRVDFRLPEERT